MTTSAHVPVLLHEVDDVLAAQRGEVVLDCTVGLGGHAQVFLSRILPGGHLYGLDADAENLLLAQETLKVNRNSVTLLHANFRDLRECNLPTVDLIFADLGVSSPHFDDPRRGFSFRFDGPLDLRFDRSHGDTASDFLKRAEEREIAIVLQNYGELRNALRYAECIVAKGQMLDRWTTKDLVDVTEDFFRWRAPSLLPQIFQALRMHINDELGALRSLLAQAPILLNPGGRLGIITFHSLEDRMVKQAFRALTSHVQDDVTGQVMEQSPFVPLTKKPIEASLTEREQNPRSRSAKFRAIQKREDAS